MLSSYRVIFENRCVSATLLKDSRTLRPDDVALSLRCGPALMPQATNFGHAIWCESPTIADQRAELPSLNCRGATSNTTGLLRDVERWSFPKNRRRSMTRRQIRTASRQRRRAHEAEFLYVLSFAKPVNRRCRPRPGPRPAQPTQVLPRPFTGLSATAACRVVNVAPSAPTALARELEEV